MNSGPYLILHKVRGEPAFDIAERMEVNGELWWIIPTIGHRAYPWRYWALEDLADIADINDRGFHDSPVDVTDKLPADWRDHYVAAERPKKRALDAVTFAIGSLQVTADELAEALAAVRGQSKESKP